jgi:hypothetical protein
VGSRVANYRGTIRTDTGRARRWLTRDKQKKANADGGGPDAYRTLRARFVSRAFTRARGAHARALANDARRATSNGPTTTPYARAFRYGRSADEGHRAEQGTAEATCDAVTTISATTPGRPPATTSV